MHNVQGIAAIVDFSPVLIVGTILIAFVVVTTVAAIVYAEGGK